MSFTGEDIEQVLRIIKECGDCELNMEIGDLKLSVAKGNGGGSTRSQLEFSTGSTVCQPVQPEQKAIAKATEPEKAEAAIEKELAPGKAENEEVAVEEGLVPIKASVVSIFYRQPSPDEPPFVEVGSEVKQDTVICLLEVMKCFRSVPAGVEGRVEKICVENGQLVEEGTVLFLVRPA